MSAQPVEYFDGTEGTLGDFGGKPLVVNFFASWCVPCLRELPGFEKVHQERGAEVAFLGVNLRDTDQAGAGVVAQTGITYNLARDRSGALFSSLGGFAMPTTLFVNAQGEVVEMVSGEISSGQLNSKIQEFFG